MKQEYAWSRRSFTGLKNGLVRITERKSIEKTNQDSEKHYKEQEEKTQQLIIDLAARAYELDKGHPPTNAADFVPEYLKAIPQDPITGTNMVYSPR